MKTVYKTAMLASAAWGLMSSLAIAAPAAPAASANQSANTVTEVTVTARRREETLKDVPISDTVYGAERLDLSGARTITDLQQTTPNLTLQVSRGTNSTLTAFIRGVGQQDPLWGFEPGVGLYIDDVYVARPQLAVLDIFDIKRVEILRGPQGTLYGRNTIGGAIKYVTAPIGDHAELDVKGTLGSYGEHDEILSAKTPLGQYFAAGFAVAKYDHNGYGKNTTLGVDQYNKNVLAYRGTLEFKPSESVFLRLTADHSVDDSNVNSGHREVPYPAPPAATVYPVLPGKYDTQGGAGSKNQVVNEGVSLMAQWAIDDHYTVKSITAYRDGKTNGIIDFDNTPLKLLDIPAHYSDHQFTQELQVLYSGEKLHGVFGAFYLNATAAGAFDTVLGLANLTVFTQGYVITDSKSVYGDLSYDVTDKLQISAGLRWTDDHKTGHVFRENYLGLKSPFFGNAAAVPVLQRSLYTNSNSYVKTTPRLSATYKLTPDLTTYISWGDGFKSGGYDMRGDQILTPQTVNGYKPETVSSTEIGLKGSVLDHRISFATDVFNMDYKNQQITTQYPSGAGVASVVDNVGASRIRGWEGETSIRVTPEFFVNAMAGYTDATYTKWIAFIPVGTPGATCTGFCDVHALRRFQNTPKWVYSVSGTYSWDLANHGRIRLSPTLAYRGKYQAFETPAPGIDQKAGYFLYDTDLVWNDASNRYEIGLHGKNLSDTRYHTGGYYFPAATSGALFGNSVTGFYGPPRTVLLTFSAKFE